MIIWAICQVYSEIWPITEHCQKYQTGLKYSTESGDYVFSHPLNQFLLQAKQPDIVPA